MINLISFKQQNGISSSPLFKSLDSKIIRARDISMFGFQKWNNLSFSSKSMKTSISSSSSPRSFPLYFGKQVVEERQIENDMIPLLGGQQQNSLGKTIRAYISLCKPRLSALVLVSTAVSFFMANPSQTFSLKSLYCCLGTSLSIASANAFNQLIEVDRDAKMNRTNDRTLPAAEITSSGAGMFATLCGAAGVGILYWGVNPLASFLAAGNIFLYAGVYTPLKVIHPINTWVGAVVGSIPLLIGWAGATGTIREAGPWALATIQYIWQIPHFLALAWKLRSDYEKGGYRMSVNVNPQYTAIQCLIWSIALLPTGALCSWSGMVDWWFTLTSFPVNASMVYYSIKFYKENSIANSTSLFKCSLFHSTALFFLLCAHKAVEVWQSSRAL